MSLYPQLIYTASDGVTIFDFNDGVNTWLVTRPKGFGLPPIDHRTFDPPLIHGSIYTGSRMGARMIRADVAFSTEGWEAMTALNEDLTDALNPFMEDDVGQVGTLSFVPYFGADTFVIDCLPIGPLDRAARRPTFQTVQVAWIAPDPLWRKWPDASVEFGSGNTTRNVNNAGKVPTPPLITLRGPWTSPRITNARVGKFVQFRLGVSAGSSLVIDMRNFRITLNGQNALYYMLPASQMWVLQRGINEITVSGVSGSGTATLQFSEQFLAVDL